MKTLTDRSIYLVAIAALSLACAIAAGAQNKRKFGVLSEKDANSVIPSSFYFAGQSAPTQMRNAAAARIGTNRLVIAGMVDTSGYSTEISGKYEGFFISDSPVKIGDKTLGTG